MQVQGQLLDLGVRQHVRHVAVQMAESVRGRTNRGAKVNAHKTACSHMQNIGGLHFPSFLLDTTWHMVHLGARHRLQRPNQLPVLPLCRRLQKHDSLHCPSPSLLETS